MLSNSSLLVTCMLNLQLAFQKRVDIHLAGIVRDCKHPYLSSMLVTYLLSNLMVAMLLYISSIMCCIGHS